VHLSAEDPIHTSHPAGQATILAVSKKNFGAAYKHSPTEGPKQRTQFATQAEMVVMAELVVVRVVPTKYFPHPSFGEQSIKVAALVQVHLSIL
jgi:hypothetical protein